MRRQPWRTLEMDIERLLRFLNYREVRQQVSLPARRSAKEAKQGLFGSQRYVATPRFDIVGTPPMRRRPRIFECKRYRNGVTPEAVRGFAYRLYLCRIPARQGVIVGYPELRPAALDAAAEHGLHVWEGVALEARLVAAALARRSPASIPLAAYRSARLMARIIY